MVEYELIDINNYKFLENVNFFDVLKIRDSNPTLHRTLFSWMRKNNVWVQLHYWPIHLHPYYKKLGFEKGYLPNSENYSESCFSIPLHFKTSQEDQDRVLSLLDEGIKEIRK